MTIKFYLAGTANQGRGGSGVCPPLEKAFQSLGIEIGTIDEADILINLNHNREVFKDFTRRRRDPYKAFLIALEPFSVYPSQYSPRNLLRYQKSYFPGNVIRQNISGDFIAWPYTFNEDPSRPKEFEENLDRYISLNFQNGVFDIDNWKKRSKTLVMIAANKVSPTNENLYGLRRSLASNLDSEDFELAGPLWTDSSLKRIHHRLGVIKFAVNSGYFPRIKPIYGDFHRRYPSSTGVVPNKHEILRNSKFSLVIENSSENITEKLFDSLINGSIPFYIGPSIEKVGIPAGVAIEGLRDRNEILARINSLTETEVSNYLFAISDFLSSVEFRNNWDSNLVFGKIARDIILNVRDLL